MKRPDLTLDERYLIHNAVLGGLATSEIGRMLRRHRSCIDTELKRGKVRGRYCPHAAQRRRDKARRRCGRNARGKDAALWRRVKAGVKRGMTPDEIAGRMAFEQKASQISFQAVYQGIKRYQWQRWLKSVKRRKHLKRPARRPYNGRAKPIGERAEDADLRIEFGHVEADSMHGKKSDDKQVIVIVERQSLYTTLLLATRRNAKRIARQIKARMQTWGLPFLSVTTDRGWEFSALGDVFEGQAYVCDPHQPNQRGTNENQIGRLRIELPKGVSMNKVTSAKLKKIENKHNHTPRKALGYLTPYEVAFQCPPHVAI
jgi:transposase, IS30 family